VGPFLGHQVQQPRQRSGWGDWDRGCGDRSPRAVPVWRHHDRRRPRPCPVCPPAVFVIGFTPQQNLLVTILTVGSQYFAPNHFSRFICVVCWNKHASCSGRKLLKRHSLWRCEYFFFTTRHNDRHDAPSGLFVCLSSHKQYIFPSRRHNAIWCRGVAAPRSGHILLPKFLRLKSPPVSRYTSLPSPAHRGVGARWATRRAAGDAKVLRADRTIAAGGGVRNPR